MRRFVLAAILLLSPAFFSGAASACPNCKESIKENDAEQVAALPGGFNSSIYLMLGGVFAVGGLVVRMIVKETRG